MLIVTAVLGWRLVNTAALHVLVITLKFKFDSIWQNIT